MFRFATLTAALLTLTTGFNAIADDWRGSRGVNEAAIEQMRQDPRHWRPGGESAWMRGWSRGKRHTLRAEQRNSHNQAATYQNGSGNRASVGQFGRRMNASITQDGDGNAATIRQLGRGNAATLTQLGSDNTACIIQIGRNVSTSLVQTGGESTGIIQNKRRTREVPLERCMRRAARIDSRQRHR